MYLFADVERWIVLVLGVGVVVLQIWALVDCLTRKAAAFPAAGKLTKPAWTGITLVAGVLGSLFVALAQSPLSIFVYITLVASLVYLADVRPAVREVSGGSGTRW